MLARVGFETLGLQTYLTAGPKEARAWTIRKGATAPEAAGVIHTDFQRGFIKAEIVSFADLVETGSMVAARRRQGPHGGQGLRHAGRRRGGVPLQRLRASTSKGCMSHLNHARPEAEGCRAMEAVQARNGRVTLSMSLRRLSFCMS